MRLTPEQRRLAANRYAGGESSSAIARDIGCSLPTVLKAARALAVPIRTASEAQRRLPLDESSFDDWSIPAACYWAGFLAADGCVRDKRNSIALSIASKDGPHVYEFRRFLGSSHRIDVRANRGYALGSRTSVCVCSRRLVQRLREAGLRQRNQSDVCPALATSPHFWRGLVDGDGCVSLCQHSPRIELVGGQRILEQFLAFVASRCPSVRTRVVFHNTIWRVVVQAATAATLLAEMYENGEVALARKRDRAIRAVEAFRTRQEELRAQQLARDARVCSTPGCRGEYYGGGVCKSCYGHKRVIEMHRRNGTLPKADRQPQAWFYAAKNTWYFHPAGSRSAPRSLGVRGRENEGAARVALALRLSNPPTSSAAPA